MSFARIRDADALRDLQESFVRFEQVQDSLVRARADLSQRVAWIAGRAEQCAGDVSQCDEVLSDAEHALYMADVPDDEGDYPDCTWERERVDDARRALSDAQRRHDECRALLRSAQDIQEAWQSSERALSMQLAERIPQAIHALRQLIDGADDYLAIAAAPASVAAAGAAGLDVGAAPLMAAVAIQKPFPPLTVELLASRSLRGTSGQSYGLKNEVRGREVVARLTGPWGERECSRLTLDGGEDGLVATIASVNLPSEVAQEKLGAAVIQNLETVARAADCKRIAVWASGANADFFRRLGYSPDGSGAQDGAEWSRDLSSTFAARQFEHARAFAALAATGRTESNEPVQLSPLDVLVPEDISQPGFWRRKNLDVDDYVELIGHWRNFSQRRTSGETEDSIRSTDWKAANAKDIFLGSEPIQIVRCGAHFAVVNGMHRVAAAQLHYLRTGEVVTLPATVVEVAGEPT